MKTTTALEKYLEALTHLHWAEYGYDDSREIRYCRRMYPALLSRIEAGDRAREELDQMKIERDYRPRMDDYERVLGERDRVLDALKQVEWVYTEHGASMYRSCQWCGGYERTNGYTQPGHAANCPRQLALGISNVTE